MNFWSGFPFVRLIIPFILGIISAIFLPFFFPYSIFIIVILFVIIGLIILFPKLYLSFKNYWWFGLILDILLFCSSYQLTIYKTENFSPLHFSHCLSDSSLVTARVSDSYIEKPKTIKVLLEILAVEKNKEWKRTKGKAMVYFQKDSNSIKLNYGEELILKTKFKEVPLIQNPGEFNYKRYLAFHNVFHQAYIKSNEWIPLNKNSGNSFYAYAIKLRNNLLTVLTENNSTGDEYAVGAALLLGYVDKLDQEIISAYASTGALHVLSVSGMHVGLIYLVLNWLLLFLDKIKNGNIIKSVLLLLFLWFYATLTGLSPSVLRASTMFSFVVIAKAFQWKTNIYNILAASALFLFFFNPYYLMDVGFQLSYIAVIGIVYLQPKIYQWFEVDNWLLDKVWAITSVSLAAQLATFPLGLHYFHQFPNYFWLSNFIVIPLSSLIIYLGIVLFSFSKIPVLVKYLAISFNWLVWLLNYSVKNIEHWAYALIQGISISVFETWLIYCIIILFLIYFERRKFNYLVLASFTSILLLFSLTIEQYNEFHQRKIIVYNIPKVSAIDFISGKSNVLLTDTAFSKNESGLLFHIKHNWWDLGINDSKVITDSAKTNNLFVEDHMIRFYSMNLFIINRQNEINFSKPVLKKKIDVDYLIVSNNPRIKIENILHNIHFKKIIFDSSNSLYRISKWKNECAKLNQPFYSMTDSSALIINL